MLCNQHRIVHGSGPAASLTAARGHVRTGRRSNLPSTPWSPVFSRFVQPAHDRLLRDSATVLVYMHFQTGRGHAEGLVSSGFALAGKLQSPTDRGCCSLQNSVHVITCCGLTLALFPCEVQASILIKPLVALGIDVQLFISLCVRKAIFDRPSLPW